ncbi:MAG TPA: ATP-binding protein [Methylophilus sp.]|uniref:hybrid sensor histidine kinase/response regulator n=1 Tax=Methylophilus sp. TaxID=29541 RepID=UPI002C2F76FB|nr:ATP-binding protein [Methylophilus sp.]HSH87782.1 ATP-binding protein [Methylophilus sp.]
MFPAHVYQTALNTSTAGQYFLSPSVDPIFLEVNDTFLEFVKLKREDVIGKRLFEVFPADPHDQKDTGLEALRRSLARVIDTGKQDKLPLQRYPIRSTKEDGTVIFEERYWRASNTPIFDEQGYLFCISHQTSEVTEKVYAEDAQKKAESRYRSLTESIDEGFCVIEVLFDERDQPIDYIFHEINPLFEEQTGLHDAKGKTMREMVPNHESRWFEMYGQVAKTGQPIRFENGSKTLGRIFDVYAYPVDEPGENMVGVLFRDVTQKRSDEEQLRLSESRLRALITATAEVVYRVSPDWSEIYQLQGRGVLKDVTNSKKLWFEEYVPPEEHEKLHTAIAKCIKQKSKFELELKVILADGSEGWLETRAVPMLDEKTGEITEWIGASTDITSRKQAEESLREAGRRKDEFLAMLAHELRNPLAPISAAANILPLAKHDPATLENCSSIIARQVKHMTGLIDDLLDMSRVTRGLITLESKEVELNDVVTHSIEQVSPLFAKHHHHLVYNNPSGHIFVRGDKNRLIQVISNILNNAAKYTPDSGRIELVLETDERFAKITVSDNGMGMEPVLINSVFELFTQASRSSDRSQGGLGIGLALAKSLVDLHEGQITAVSPGLGMGSQFQILLPLIQSVGADSVDGGSNILDTGDTIRTTKILVVDDNVDAADMTATLLEMSGYKTIVEYDPLKAIERAKIEMPAVLILDLGLPQMDGKELARLLRREPEIANATFIALTGYGEEQEMANAIAAGFDHFFMKPMDTTRLLDVLKDLK